MTLAKQTEKQKTTGKISGGISWVWSSPRIEVRGHSTCFRPATRGMIIAARTADGLLITLLFSVILISARATPIPQLWWTPAYVAIALIYALGFKSATGRTPGEFFWHLAPNPARANLRSGNLFPPANGDWIAAFKKLLIGFWESLWEARAADTTPSLLQYKTPGGPESYIIGGTMTFLIAAFTYWGCYRAVFSFPLWHQAETVELDAYFPARGNESSWSVVPFFYGLGAWPATYRGEPVIHTFPYEKGPPLRFTGHIVAHWGTQGTTVTFEGPRTPRENYSRSEIEDCMKSSAFLGGLGGFVGSPFGCLRIRESILSRHIEEMRQRLATYGIEPTRSSGVWSLRWFLVNNPAIPAEEQAQGILLSASNGSYTQKRYIIITPKGTHQTFILSYPTRSVGLDPETAPREVFEKSIRSLRVSDDLGQGVAWIDRRLENIHLNDIGSMAESDKKLQALTEVQGLLLSKISVDPKTFDSYYHLAGVSLTLARLASQQLSRQASNAQSLSDAPILKEIISNSKGIIESASKYGEDVASSNKSGVKLREMWQFAEQAKKIKSGF